mgnify:FL=1|tara:strand:+ start:113 stop:1198 length:1086 start_codon:yes stop_codon:yes gene_type:complete
MPYNPGNVRRLNALGGKRPQATGIAILPKNRGNVITTSEGSVNNYGGNKKMGLYSNVGMSYNFQNLNLTGARINGNLPYFWGGNQAVTAVSKKENKNMITLTMVDDGNKVNNNGQKGLVTKSFYKLVSKEMEDAGLIHDSYIADSAGLVNSKEKLQVQTSDIVAIQMWRGEPVVVGADPSTKQKWSVASASNGPVDYAERPGIHIWAQKPLAFNSVVIQQGGVKTTLKVEAAYDCKNLPPETPAVSTAATIKASSLAGNCNNQISEALKQEKTVNGNTVPDISYPADAALDLAPNKGVRLLDTTTVYWLPFDTKKNAAGVIQLSADDNSKAARKIFPQKSAETAAAANKNLKSPPIAVYFK